MINDNYNLGWILKNVVLPSPDHRLNSSVGRLEEKTILSGCPMYFALNLIFSAVFKTSLPTRIYVNKICTCDINECHFWYTNRILANEVLKVLSSTLNWYKNFSFCLYFRINFGSKIFSFLQRNNEISIFAWDKAQF